MSILSAYVFRSLLQSIAVVLLFIGILDIIIQLTGELDNLNRSYHFFEALLNVIFRIPASLYQHMPFASLIGALVGLGNLASTGELVIMRASGISLLRISWWVIRPVLVFIVCMLILAEYIIPIAEPYADNRRSSLLNHHPLSSLDGVWHKEGNTFIHINRVQPNGKLSGITRRQYDEAGLLFSDTFSKTALYIDGQWREEHVEESTFRDGGVVVTTYPSRIWKTDVSPDFLAVIAQDVDSLSISKLHHYTAYLDNQKVDNKQHLLSYWSKVLQPLVIISLVLVAASFVFGPLRNVTIGYRVVTGVMVGIVFQLIQKLLGPASLLYGIPPLLAVLLPIIVCLSVGWILLLRTR